jgi:hypothetical protein
MFRLFKPEIFAFFSSFGANFNLPGSGSADQIESGSETLRSNRGLTCAITRVANLRPQGDSLSEAYFFSLHASL